MLTGHPLPDRDALLRMGDDELLHHCRVEVCRGSGRGGQKRNVTDSAVRLTLPTDPEISVSCDTTRSQHRNRSLALAALRRRIALHLRSPQPAAGFALEPKPGLRNPAYPRWLAALLDCLAATDWRMAAAARRLGVSTGRLARLLARDPELWRRVNQQRQRRGLHPLRKL